VPAKKKKHDWVPKVTSSGYHYYKPCTGRFKGNPEKEMEQVLATVRPT
jgi:hypothetical protein